jgi:hypothetical protein
MRDIVAWSLMIWLGFGLGACGPQLPGLGSLTPSAREGGAAFDPGTGVPPPWESTGDALPVGSSRPGGDAAAPGLAVVDAAAPADAKGDGPRADAGDLRDAPVARAPRAGEIVVDELLVDPAGNDLGHEWVEVANLTGEPLDLATLHVADGATDVAVDARVLPGAGFLVLGQSIDRAHNGDAPVDVAYGTKLALGNGADQLVLCLGPCASGVRLDAVAWASAWGDAYVGHAVVIEREGTTCPAEVAYRAGGNFGSPGRANPPCPRVVAEPARDGGDARPDR